MKKLTVVLLLALSGCAAKPISTARTDNTDVTVDRLFTVDGCTVYRFRDGALGYHYFTSCAGGTSVREPRGKASVEIEVPTAVRP